LTFQVTGVFGWIGSVPRSNEHLLSGFSRLAPRKEDSPIGDADLAEFGKRSDTHRNAVGARGIRSLFRL